VATSNDPDQALSYLHRACSLASLAVKHIDAAVALISTFLDPKDVAATAEMADDDAYISEVLDSLLPDLFIAMNASNPSIRKIEFILFT
jgi:hypothetical protein